MTVIIPDMLANAVLGTLSVAVVGAVTWLFKVQNRLTKVEGRQDEHHEQLSELQQENGRITVRLGEMSERLARIETSVNFIVDRIKGQ